MEYDLAEFDAAYHERLRAGQSRWHPGEYDAFEMRPFLEAMLAASALTVDTSNVLDLGCGTGQASLFFAQRGAHVTGVDCATTAIELARQVASTRGLAAEFVLGDVRSVALAAAHYDLIVDGRFLHCVVDWADRIQVLGVMRAALKPHGEVWSETMVGVPRIRSGQGFHVDEEGIFWKALAPGTDYPRTLARDGVQLSPIRRIHTDVTQLNTEWHDAGFAILHQELLAPPDDYSVSMAQTRLALSNS